MIVSTTPTIEGRRASGRLGVIAAQGVLGVSGRSRSYENELASGVSDSLAELERQAQMLTISASATAVKLS